MRFSAMPKAFTLSMAVEMAQKCSPTFSSPKASSDPARAVLALVMVSMVVKVLEATRNSVVSASGS